MQFRFLILLLFGIMSCYSEAGNKTEEQLMDIKSIEHLEKSGFQIFKDTPRKAIPIFKKVATNYEKLKQYKKAAQTNLNIANIYDEHANSLDSALIYSNKSLSIWAKQKDSLQMANLYKYIGLLKGKKGAFEEAQSAIFKAIDLYEAQGFEQGIAVSEFNLADVYFRQKQYAQSEALFIKSTEFWRSKGKFSRVFTNNMMGIQLYAQLGKENLVQQLIEENMEIKNQNNLNDFIKNKFNELMLDIKKKPNANK